MIVFKENSERQRLPICGSWSRKILLIPWRILADGFDILVFPDCKFTYVALDKLAVRKFGLSDRQIADERTIELWGDRRINPVTRYY